MKEATAVLLKNLGKLALGGIVSTLASRGTHATLNFIGRKFSTNTQTEPEFAANGFAPDQSEEEILEPDESYASVSEFVECSSDSHWFSNMQFKPADFKRWHDIMCSIKEYNLEDLTVDVFVNDTNTVTINLMQDEDKVESYYFSV